jgi:hypothetical protein
MDRHDERLKAAYVEMRRDEDEQALASAPDIDELLSRRAPDGSPRQARPIWQRLPGGPLIPAFALVAAVLVTAFFLTRTSPEAESGPVPSHPEQGLVIAEGPAPQHSVEATQDFDWDDLLDFVDEIWEWESPTEFLL